MITYCSAVSKTSTLSQNNIHSWVEDECCCTVISNVNFTTDIQIYGKQIVISFITYCSIESQMKIRQLFVILKWFSMSKIDIDTFSNGLATSRGKNSDSAKWYMLSLLVKAVHYLRILRSRHCIILPFWYLASAFQSIIRYGRLSLKAWRVVFNVGIIKGYWVTLHTFL